MLKFNNYLPTPEEAENLLEWLRKEVCLDDYAILYHAIDFIVKKRETEFRQHITKEFLQDN